MKRKLFAIEHSACAFCVCSERGTEDFTKCCNLHDECYGTCGKDKEQCDNEFKSCANRQCSRAVKKAECRSSVNYYMIALKMVSCPMYTSAQESICDCGEFRGGDL